MIEVQDLSKTFGSKQVLRNIKLRVDTGCVVGIIGENGAGKTTLFRCIAGLEDYHGKIVSEIEPLKNHLGLLTTEPYFFSKITGREYIQLLCNARKQKIANIDESNIFELPLSQYASTYSTGMKKKLALTALLLQKNEYFILDEPFNGVDIQSNIVITAIIKKLRASGKTVLLSSHILSTLRETCDEIHHLRHGEFVKVFKREEFSLLEEEMNESSIGDKIDRLRL